jgi:hypothetical protein
MACVRQRDRQRRLTHTWRAPTFLSPVMFVMVKPGANALLILSPCSYTPS